MAFLPFIGAAAGAGASTAGGFGIIGAAQTFATAAAAGAGGGGIGAASLLTGLTAAGTGLNALSSIRAAEFNEGVARRNASLAAQKGQIDAAAFRRRSRAEQGQRIANIAASGVGFEGSPLAILASSAEQDEFDALLIEQGAANKASGFRAEAGFHKRRALSAGIGGVFGVGTSILSGVKNR